MARQIISTLDKASRHLSVYLDAQAQDLGVSSIEGQLLSYLRGNDTVAVGDLIGVFGIKQSTLTSILDRLEKPGFLRREMNPADRRSFLVHITKAGRKPGKRLNRLLKTLEGEIRQRVSARDLEGFQTVIGAVEHLTHLPARER